MRNGAQIAAEDDDRVLQNAAEGDATAFAGLVRRHQAMVFSLAHRFLRDRSAAEDVAQDVFLELYRNLSALCSGRHLMFWLRRVTSHRCLDRLRRAKGQSETTLESATEPAAVPDGRDVLLDARLREVVATLAPAPRLVVLLRYQEDLDPSEIAAILDMPVNTVKSHLRRSLVTLRQRLSGALHEV